MAKDPLLGSISDADVVEALSSMDSVADVMLAWGNEMTQDLRNSLRKEQSAGTSLALQQSIKALPLQVNESTITLAIVMLDYYGFTNKGVEGIGGVKADGTAWVKRSQQGVYRFSIDKKPRLTDKTDASKGLKFWAQSKGIEPFAVQNSIWHRGIEGTLWFDNVVTQKRFNELSEKVAKVGAENLVVSLKILLEK